ncbi:MAG: 4Fe-4S ferredoxin [Pseudomonadales bacterium]|nr:4Fe-4S ferredoxin [Pseudomonadales bacterium]MDG1443388.1 4Fe-4S ferredoxin [Pseudomonadales bacterium]
MHDIVIVGSGPAGVSAAFPLLEGGRDVLMLDGGKTLTVNASSDGYLKARLSDTEQSKWMIGSDFQALRFPDAVSPKLRVPTQSFAFDSFASVNRIESNNVVALGSLATGGLSNSWGCGVAAYSEDALETFPCQRSAMTRSYENVATRVGISGVDLSDDLSEYFGVDDWTSGEIPLDNIHNSILQTYEKRRASVQRLGVKMGVARKAVLSADSLGRKGCNLCGNCLFGCTRQSLYSSVSDVERLKTMPSFRLEPGTLVERIEQMDHGWRLYVLEMDTNDRRIIDCNTLVMAAGTLATTRLVFECLSYEDPVQLLSCPTAAFLLWKPSFLGSPVKEGFGLGQLSFSVQLPKKYTAFGSLFSPVGIPISEFVRQIPLQSKVSARIMKNLLSSTSIGNVFLPGQLSNITVRLGLEHQLIVEGGYSTEAQLMLANARKKLMRAFLKLGVILIPGSFTTGLPGGDIHYAGTIPMKSDPKIGESSEFCEPATTRGLFVVDGASLPYLSEQSHTLTIMANADRVANHIVSQGVDL